MSKSKYPLVIAGMLAVSLNACATKPPSAVEVREAVCPVPLSRMELYQVADALESLPPSPEVNLLAGIIERFDDAAIACRG